MRRGATNRYRQLAFPTTAQEPPLQSSIAPAHGSMALFGGDGPPHSGVGGDYIPSVEAHEAESLGNEFFWLWDFNWGGGYPQT